MLLLGGTTASGKSTSARKLARQLGIGCISGDSLWKALIKVTTPQTHPVLHRWPRPDAPTGCTEDLARLHIAEAETLTPALEAFIDSEMTERNRFVFHAAWITPELAAQKCASSDAIRAVFIDEPEVDGIIASVLERSGRTEPTDRQVVMSKVALLYGDWLREGAQRHGLPLVSARPRETLVDRIVQAADQLSRPAS